MAVAWTASFVVAPAGDVMMRIYCWLLVMVAIVAAYSAGRKTRPAAGGPPVATNGALRRPFWQFTLREMLLGVVIVSLAMVVATKSRPFKKTPFFDSLEHNRLHAVRRKIEVTSTPDGHGFVSTAESEATWEDEDDIDGSGAAKPGAKPDNVISALCKEIDAHLRHLGCKIYGEWHSDGELLITYELGATIGTARAYLVPVWAGHWKLRMLVDESREE